MTRTVRRHQPIVGRSLFRLVATVLASGVFLAAGTADAALTTPKCLLLKRKAWITFRKCQGTEDVKRLQGKPTDLGKCQTTFQTALGKITANATKAAIACRYVDNGDQTVTDFDTGLMWEKKIDQAFWLPCALSNFPSCVTRTFKWAPAMDEFISELNGFFIEPPTSSQFGHAGHTDWRLPTFAELGTIVDKTAPGCITGSPCIDPAFGPTFAGVYWTATTFASFPDFALNVDFSNGGADNVSGKTSRNFAVRAVRTGL